MGSVPPLPDMTHREQQPPTWPKLDSLREWTETAAAQAVQPGPERANYRRRLLSHYVIDAAQDFLSALNVEQFLALAETTAGVYLDDLAAVLALVDEERGQ